MRLWRWLWLVSALWASAGCEDDPTDLDVPDAGATATPGGGDSDAG